jgi:homoserine dehydrogenase
MHSREESLIPTYTLCLLGFGNVNRALVRLLQKKEPELRERDIAYRITGIATRRLGWLSNANGMDLSALGKENIPASQNSKSPASVRDWLREAHADVLFEATSLDPHTGQPAIDHIRAALEMEAHAITANKGPVVHAYDELRSLATAKSRRFLFESTVMDGAPIFSLFRDSLPAVHLRGFRGILNSTTNVILSSMEEGLDFEQALRNAQEIGVAETDPSHDIDGWDATVKVAALVTVLMGVPIRRTHPAGPDQARRNPQTDPGNRANCTSSGKTL